ncbi:MAG: hypothetical protein ACHBN1_18940 [Heteroscytonema crispum UTEX LB 1556]
MGCGRTRGTRRQLTTNNQPQRGSPESARGKTPLRPLGRPQDRSGGPTKGASARRGESSRLQTQAPLHHQQPTTNNQQPTTNHQPPTND